MHLSIFPGSQVNILIVALVYYANWDFIGDFLSPGSQVPVASGLVGKSLLEVNEQLCV